MRAEVEIEVEVERIKRKIEKLILILGQLAAAVFSVCLQSVWVCVCVSAKSTEKLIGIAACVS